MHPPCKAQKLTSVILCVLKSMFLYHIPTKALFFLHYSIIIPARSIMESLSSHCGHFSSSASPTVMECYRWEMVTMQWLERYSMTVQDADEKKWPQWLERDSMRLAWCCWRGGGIVALLECDIGTWFLRQPVSWIKGTVFIWTAYIGWKEDF